ncbi:MAG: NADH-quinone oxidoreductase subunit G, partial [Gammaproteobacteria bacterium]|nr:NADH-quinone oxidoreductase subunit G [Gammaproteobacteria bacterium]
MSEELIKVEIDGRQLQARKGALVIDVAQEAGITIPRFCYHKKLSIAATCRMCLVDVEKLPKPVPACSTQVMDGMKVFTKSARVRDAQKAVMEFLLINHPLDCPICDQGGECELQDVAMGFGGDVSRFNEGKRVVKDKDIGPLIATDMTRCIHCTRCVRFGEEIAGIRELGATGRGENMEIGTYVGKSVDSELSGNVIDLCPVGALTSKPSRFASRSWEVMQRSSVAPHDCVGSNVYLHVNRGRVKRVVPRENDRINESWLSDCDRFSFQGLYSEDRLIWPKIKNGGKWETTDWETALSFAVAGLKRVVAESGADQLGGLVSPSSTLEEMYLFQKLLGGMGTANVDHRIRQADFSDQDEAPLFPWLGQSVADLERLNAVLLIGSNIRKEQPIANLRIRKAVLKGARVMFVNPVDYAYNYPVEEKAVVSPGQMVNTLAAIARAVQGDDSTPEGALGELLAGAGVSEQSRRMAANLQEAEYASVLLGQTAIAHPQLSLLRALAGYISEKTGASFGYLPTANGAGGWIAGAVPHREVAGKTAKETGIDARSMLEKGLNAYLLLGVEPELDCWDTRAAHQAMDAADFVVALTAYHTGAMEKYADVMLPITPFAETSGTFINVEGIWQSFAAAALPLGDSRPTWKVLRVMGNLFELDGFDYRESTEIKSEILEHKEGRDPQNLGAWMQPTEGARGWTGITRIGEMPIYAVDPLVRRAQA